MTASYYACQDTAEDMHCKGTFTPSADPESGEADPESGRGLSAKAESPRPLARIAPGPIFSAQKSLPLWPQPIRARDARAQYCIVPQNGDASTVD